MNSKISLIVYLPIMVFFLTSCGREDPKKILEEFILSPLPAGIEVLESGSIKGIAGSIRVYKLRLNQDALEKLMLARGKYAVSLSDEEKLAKQKILEKYGGFKIDSLNGFETLKFEESNYNVSFFIKSATAYCIISR